MNKSPAISTFCTPVKLAVDTTTPSLHRRTDGTNIKQFIHRNLSNAVLDILHISARHRTVKKEAGDFDGKGKVVYSSDL